MPGRPKKLTYTSYKKLCRKLLKFQDSSAVFNFTKGDPHKEFILLRTACDFKDTSLIGFLVELVSIDWKNLVEGFSLIADASKFWSIDVVRFLVQNGANDRTDSIGFNAVCNAVVANRVDVLNFLLEMGFRPVSDSGRNALEEACCLDREPFLIPLLRTGAPLTISMRQLPFLSHPGFLAAGLMQENENKSIVKPKTVFSLILCCRNAIRRNLNPQKQNFFGSVPLLPLPKRLQMFVLVQNATDENLNTE